MAGCRTALCAALSLEFCVLAGCAEFGGVQGQAFTYNVAADDANNQELLLNLVRAAHDRPTEWTSIRQVTGTVNLSGTLGLTAPLGHTAAARTLSPSATVGSQTLLPIDVLDAREFYQNYLKEIPIETIAYYQHHDLDAYLYYVFFSGVIIATRDDRFVVSNNPGSPTLRENFRPTFGDKLEPLFRAFFDAQLVAERIGGEKPIGPPLTAADAKRHLREIVTATTTKDGPSLGKGEEKGQYQLQKSADTDRYCLRGQSLVDRL